MLDEPDEPAHKEDFYSSKAINLLDTFCARCGDEGVTILNVAFIPNPGEV